MDQSKSQVKMDLEHLFPNLKIEIRKMKTRQLKRRGDMDKYQNISKDSTNKKKRSSQERLRKRKTQKLHQVLEECLKKKDNQCFRN